jgi:hypothetical protein
VRFRRIYMSQYRQEIFLYPKQLLSYIHWELYKNGDTYTESILKVVSRESYHIEQITGPEIKYTEQKYIQSSAHCSTVYTEN